MRIGIIVCLILALRLHSAEDADDFYSRGLDSLRQAQSNHAALVPATKLLTKAAELFEAVGDETKAAEVNSCLYWAKKKLTLGDTESFNATPAVVSRLELVTKAIDSSSAQQWLDRAGKVAKDHPSDYLLIAIQYFEVGDRFKDTDQGRVAISRSLEAMQHIGEKSSPIAYKSTATDGKAFIQSDPNGALIFIATDGLKRDTGKKTPSLIAIPKGTQIVSIELEGMKLKSVDVEIGETIFKPPVVKLEPITIAADILFDPGWTVLVDGKVIFDEQGKPPVTPCTALLPLGTHNVNLMRTGFLDLSQHVQIKNAPLSIEFKGKPTPGQSSILAALERDKLQLKLITESRLLGKWEKPDHSFAIVKPDHTLKFSADGGVSHWEVIDEKSFRFNWAWGGFSACTFLSEDTFSEGGQTTWVRIKNDSQNLDRKGKK